MACALQQLAFMPGLDWTQASAEAWLFSCFTCLVVSRPAWDRNGGAQLAQSELTRRCGLHSSRADATAVPTHHAPTAASARALAERGPL